MLDFESLPLYWVNRLSALARRELKRQFRSAGHDVSPEEWAILLLLWRKDAQYPGEMSARTVRDPTTMTRLIDTMVRKGFVKRRADSKDRRRSMICLQAKGRALEPVLIALANPMIERSLKGIAGGDIATTLQVLQQMEKNLSRDKTERAKA